MAYEIRKTDGGLLTYVEDQTINESVCSLSLAGRGSMNYGQVFAESFVHLLEHFASTQAPTLPIAGQMWFDTGTETVRVYNGANWLNVGGSGGSAYTIGSGLSLSGATLSLGVSGVSPGTYTNSTLSVDAFGRVTAVSNGSALTLPPSGVAAGTYTNATITVGLDGRISAASTGTGAGTSGLSQSEADSRYLKLSGGTLTGPLLSTGIIDNPTAGVDQPGYIAPTDRTRLRTGPNGVEVYGKLFTSAPVEVPALGVGTQGEGDLAATGRFIAIGDSDTGIRWESDGFYTFWTNNLSRWGIGQNGNLAPQADNAFTLGTASSRVNAIWSANGTIQTSDARLKTEIRDSDLGLDFVNALRPVRYRWVEGGTVFEGPVPVVRPGARVHYGLLAQDVKETVDAAGVEDFAGWVLADQSRPDSAQALRYDQFIAPLVRAVQELSAEVRELRARISGRE